MTTRIRLGRAPGVELEVWDLGARVHRLVVTDADGQRRDVALALPDAAAYLASPDYVGAVIGRFANRIAGGRCEVDGRTVQLATNDRGNHLHGGDDGFDRRTWELLDSSEQHALLGLTSPDGDQGYPGTVRATVRYAVAGDTVSVDLEATTDAATVLGLTHHLYVDLDGPSGRAGAALDHLLTVPADRYLPVDDTGVPLPGSAAVDDTPFDLRAGARLGAVLAADHPQLDAAGGVDHAYLVAGQGVRPVAVLDAARSGLRLEVRSDRPAVHVYTGNGLDGSTVDRAGRPVGQHAAVALEPEVQPDAPHRDVDATLRPGQTYRSRIEWHFSRAPGPAAH